MENCTPNNGTVFLIYMSSFHLCNYARKLLKKFHSRVWIIKIYFNLTNTKFSSNSFAHNSQFDHCASVLKVLWLLYLWLSYPCCGFLVMLRFRVAYRPMFTLLWLFHNAFSYPSVYSEITALTSSLYFYMLDNFTGIFPFFSTSKNYTFLTIRLVIKVCD